MDNRKVVFYIRLSIDDNKTESMSLSTQEQILQSKLLLMPEYLDKEVVKLIDNGFSGTTFDRPSINKLMEMVKQQQVACIMVKDFSRLGRDMSQVGYLTESVFPRFYTRLVAVTDGYDSNDHYECTGGLEVAFRFLMSEYYSKDLGRKVSVAKQSKIEKGELVIKHPFYGYKLDDMRKYIIDEDVADNIRLIYKLAIDGLTLNEIVVKLQELKILTPSAYRKRFNKNYLPATRTVNVWNVNGISNILHNVRYTGVYTKGTYSGTLTQKKCEENGDTYIENHHPAIISKEIFDKVQQRFTLNRIKRNISQYPMKGKIVCGICGHSLTKIKTTQIENSSFACKRMQLLDEYACSKTKVSLKFLCKEVLASLKKRVFEIIEIGDNLPTDFSFENNKTEMILSIETTKSERKKVYESFINSDISKEEYLKERDRLNAQIEELSAIQEVSKIKNQNSKEVSSKLLSLKDMQLEILGATELSIELAEKYTKKITVFPDNSLNIEFLFDEIFENTQNQTKATKNICKKLF